jgi:hypothetical protein
MPGAGVRDADSARRMGNPFFASIWATEMDGPGDRWIDRSAAATGAATAMTTNATSTSRRRECSSGLTRR